MHDNQQTTVSKYMTTLREAVVGFSGRQMCSYQLHDPCIEQTTQGVCACFLTQALPIPLFAADEAANQQSEVQITLGIKGVDKGFIVPGQHLQELLDVYGLLQHLQVSSAIRCTFSEGQQNWCEGIHVPSFASHCIVAFQWSCA